MARSTPPGIDPVPTPAIQRGDRATFSGRVDAFILWLVNAVTQFGNVASNVYNNAVDAFQSATSASTSASNAGTSASQAAGSATSAGNSATAAAGSATSASTSAANAATSATALTATSTTQQTVSTGSKTFVVQSGKQFVSGAPIYIVNPDDATEFMSGTVTSYSGTSLVVNITTIGSVDTVSNWNITVSGARGATGATGNLSGGNLTGALNYIKGGDVTSASTTNIWASAGNYITVFGSATITSFGTAPQAGSQRRLLIGAAMAVTSGANLIVKGAGSGNTIPLNIGDELDVYAESTTRFRVTLIKSDGRSVAPASYELIASTNVTTAVSGISYPNLFSDQYDTYHIHITNFAASLNGSATSQQLILRYSRDGSTYDSGANYFTSLQTQANSFFPVTSISVGIASGIITIEGVRENVQPSARLFKADSSHVANGTVGYSQIIGLTQLTPATGFILFFSGGASISSGTIRIYGVRNN